MSGDMKLLGGDQSITGRIDVAKAADGALHLFGVCDAGGGDKGRVMRLHQFFANGAWSDWEDIGAPAIAGSSVKLAIQDGLFNIFSLDPAVGYPFRIRQNQDGTWQEPEIIIAGLDTPITSLAGVGFDNQGFHLFGTNLRGQIWCGDFDPAMPGQVSWNLLQGASGFMYSDNEVPAPVGYVVDVAVTTNQDGRLEVFALKQDRTLSHISKDLLGQWGDWTTLEGWIIGTPAVATNANGCLALAVCGGDGVLYYNSQRSAGSPDWVGWTPIDGNGFYGVTLAGNVDGRLSILAVRNDYTLWTTSQINENRGDWFFLALLSNPANSLDALKAVANEDGRIEVFTRGKSGRQLLHMYQLQANAIPNSGWS